MKILYVSYHYAPYNCVAAVRATKMTKYLHKQGHDIRVLTAKNQLLPDDLELEIDEQRVIYSEWKNINKPFEILAGGKSEIAKKRSYLNSNQKQNRLFKRAIKLYKSIVYFPDEKIGWIPDALKEVKALLKKWVPDVVYVSGGPFSGFILGSLIHRKYGLPWIAEFRDLWTQAHNYKYGETRIKIEERLERLVVSSASRFVTVSEPLANQLRDDTDKEISVITNGFDPDDRKQARVPDDSFDDSMLHIVYTGQIYIENQSLSPLFEAIKNNEKLKRNVTIHFYGPNLEDKIGQKYDPDLLEEIRSNIQYYGLVSRDEAMKAQERADLLLLLGWNDKNYKGILTGKLFEYLGAKRMVLALNNYLDDASKLVVSSDVGYFCKSSEEVSNLLLEFLDLKDSKGFTPYIQSHNFSQYSYTELAKKVATVSSRGI